MSQQNKILFYQILIGYLNEYNSHRLLTDDIINIIYKMYIPYQLMRHSLCLHPLFSFEYHKDTEFSITFINRTIEMMHALFIKSNEYIIHKDEEMDSMYLIESGSFISESNDPSQTTIKQSGDIIGAFQLLYNDESNQSVKSISKESIIWKLSSDSYDTVRAIMMLWNNNRYKKIQQKLSEIAIFDKLSEQQLFAFVHQCKFETYHKDEFIISKSQSEHDDNVYIILNGIVSVHIYCNGIDLDEAKYRENEYFVWKLLPTTGNKKSFAKSCSESCKILKINHKKFRSIMTSNSLSQLKSKKS